MSIHSGVVTIEDGRKFYAELRYGPLERDTNSSVMISLDIYYVDEDGRAAEEVPGDVQHERVGNGSLWGQVYDLLSETQPDEEGEP